MVFLYHIVEHYKAIGGQLKFVTSFSTFGFSGVEIFFVISGFVGAHTTWKRARTWGNAWDFLRRRLLRIYLGYWPFWLVTLIVTAHYSSDALAKIDLTKSFFLATPDMFVLLLPVTWSLSYELIFYAFVAATFVITTRAMKLLITGICASLLAMVITTLGQHYSTLQGFASLTLEFTSGYLLYVHHQKLKNLNWAIPLFVVTVIAFSMGIYLHASDNAIRIITFGTGALATVALAVCLESTGRLSASRFWTNLGDASFTIYLAHLPAISLFYHLGIRDFIARQSPVLREITFGAFICVTLWLCRQFYFRIEAPIYQWAVTSTSRRFKVAPYS
jgi:peptidoglycan/LPS O-acetylase OafA/YrhL